MPNTNRTVKLTAVRIRDLELTQERSSQYFVSDTEIRGLRVRVTRTRKTFVYEPTARLNGKRPRLPIGDATIWTIDDARTEARRLQTLIDRGIDPRDERAARIAEAESTRQRTLQEAQAKAEQVRRAAVTLTDAWTVYVEARKPHWSERHYLDHINAARSGGEKKLRGKGKTSPGPLASLAGETLADITSETLADWLETESAERPTQARLAFGLLQTFARWCDSKADYKDLIDPGIFTAPEVRDALPGKNTKDDVLQKEQLNPWFAAVRQIDNPVISAYLQALLLTGARREEMGTLTWENVDFQWGSLRIADKVEGERVIPLTPYVASLLAALPRRNQWVFSSPTGKTGRLREPRLAHNRALTAAALPNVTLHGLRRSFGTLAEWVEMPVGIVAQIMGHAPSALAERHYRRRPIDLLRKWHTKLEAWVLEQADIEQPKETSAERVRRVK